MVWHSTAMPQPAWLARQAHAERASKKRDAGRIGSVFADACARRRKLFDELRAAVDAGDVIREQRVRAEIEGMAM